MGKYRDKKLANVIKQTIANMLIEGEIKDPRISGFITVTDVECSRDLRYATVYISVIGEEHQQDKTILGIRSATGFIKRKLSDVLTVRWMPELIFKLDDSLEKASKIYKKIEEVTTVSEENELQN